MSELDEMIKAAHALADKELNKLNHKRGERIIMIGLVCAIGLVVWCLVG